MRLLIVSHTPHYRRNGAVVGWGSTIREIDQLARLFRSVVHVAPLYSGDAPGSAMAYESERVRVHPVEPAGGARLRDKVRIPLRYPAYARAILQELRTADVVHVRAPANISLLALILLAFVRRPTLRWAKYAGDWKRRPVEPWSYRFQRWCLTRRFHRGVVTMNGRVPDQAEHVHSFLNPCLTNVELEEGAAASQKKQLYQPVQLLFVGRLESGKGVDVCLEVLAQLTQEGIAAQLALVGEGEERQQLEQRSRDLGVVSLVSFHGGLPRNALGRFYARAHFILLPSNSEGWPKVLSEAMAYGVVPIASAVGSIPEYLEEFGTGCAINSRSPRPFAEAIRSYVADPSRWANHSARAVGAAQPFSYGSYLQAVGKLLDLPGPG